MNKTETRILKELIDEIEREFNIPPLIVEKAKRLLKKNEHKLIRKKRTIKIKSPLKLCDELYSELIILRAGHKCEKENCNKRTKLQAHHIFSRVYFAIRHDPENGVCLCRYHHLYWAHRFPVEFMNWIKKKRDIEKLEMIKNNQAKKDYKLIEIYLRQEISNIRK